MKKIELLLIIIFILLVGYFGVKFTLQRLIIDNYVMREKGLARDEFYWADKLYMSWFGLQYKEIIIETDKRMGR